MTPSQKKKLLKNGQRLVESLYECFIMIEHNTKGLALDVKDEARLLLADFGLICKGENYENNKVGKEKPNGKSKSTRGSKTNRVTIKPNAKQVLKRRKG